MGYQPDQSGSKNLWCMPLQDVSDEEKQMNCRGERDEAVVRKESKNNENEGVQEKKKVKHTNKRGRNAKKRDGLEKWNTYRMYETTDEGCWCEPPPNNNSPNQTNGPAKHLDLKH